MAPKILPEAIDAYLTALVPDRELELRKMEAYADKVGFPIIGPACGHFCYQLARLMGARRVFELGSGYGYSTAWFARGVKENGGGTVYHVVWDADLSAQARGHLTTLGFADVVQYRVGEAVEILRKTNETFDMVFLDIDKQGYPAALPVMKERLRPGGVMLVDNMFRRGTIVDPNETSAANEGVRTFTRTVVEDPDWIASIVPLRDGLMMAWKRPTS
jgi:predicted O-methyltransferase YrrM